MAESDALLVVRPAVLERDRMVGDPRAQSIRRPRSVASVPQVRQAFSGIGVA